jgi:hypothetical protein
MEHARLPHDFDGELPDVPYVCTEDYDGSEDFFDFTEYYHGRGWERRELFCRKQWDESFRCDDVECHIHKCDCNRAHSIVNNTEFLQRWLFFGLLKTFLGPLYRQEDFIRVSNTSDKKKVLTTVHLRSLIEQWVEDFNKITDPVTETWTLDYHERNLTEVREVYLHICESTTVDVHILLAIGLLGEQLVGAVRANTAITTTDFDTWKHPTNLESNSVTKYIASSMLEKGWCIADLCRLGWFDLTSIWFISNMNAIRGGDIHQQCSQHSCRSLTHYLREDYQTRHVEDSCDCGFISISQNQLYRSLVRSEIPCIPATSAVGIDEDLDVIELSSSRRRHVAISHVWADGLGNPHANSLPSCQHLALSGYAKALYSDNYEGVTYWIDTLACPVDPAAKKLALQMMGRIYKEAEKVLVLDSALMALNHKQMDLSEIVIRVDSKTVDVPRRSIREVTSHSICRRRVGL